MPVAESVANGFFLAYFSISLDQVGYELRKLKKKKTCNYFSEIKLE
jgi:hypothetical protein